MSAKLLALWVSYRWLLAKVLAPLVLLLPCVVLLWIPQVERSNDFAQQQELLQEAVQNQGALRHDVDSLHTDLDRLLQFRARISSRPEIVVPTLDSLRREAERSGLTVTDLSEATGNSGFSSVYRFELDGIYRQLLVWVDSLAALHPKLQIVRLHWSANPQAGMHHLSGLELGRWDFHTRDTTHSDVAAWIARARNGIQIASLGTGTSTELLDPFRGPVPLQVMQKTAVTAVKVAPSKPLAPAPKLNIIGLVGGRLATVNTEKGERRLLRVGDVLGDWTVESISNSGMVLRNQGETKAYNVR